MTTLLTGWKPGMITFFPGAFLNRSFFDRATQLNGGFKTRLKITTEDPVGVPRRHLI